jgi:hypothetical protein
VPTPADAFFSFSFFLVLINYDPLNDGTSNGNNDNQLMISGVGSPTINLPNSFQIRCALPCMQRPPRRSAHRYHQSATARRLTRRLAPFLPCSLAGYSTATTTLFWSYFSDR